MEWASHEQQPGVYTFEGNLDIESYFQLAQKFNLSVILRPGPFIDAERDMVIKFIFNVVKKCIYNFVLCVPCQGGLPFWLLSVDPSIKLRTSDKSKNLNHFPSIELTG